MNKLYVLITAMSAVTVSGQLLVKRGVTQTLTPLSEPTLFKTALLLAANPLVLSGLGLSAVGVCIWMAVLARAELSYVFPLTTGLFYILLLLASKFILLENVTPLRWIGVFTILVGIALVAKK